MSDDTKDYIILVVIRNTPAGRRTMCMDYTLSSDDEAIEIASAMAKKMQHSSFDRIVLFRDEPDDLVKIAEYKV